jgi:segregation and condensation protein A
VSVSQSVSRIEELPPPAAQDSTPDTTDGMAFARLYGEPLFTVPQDLYIPPDALEVFLEAFEGPLDLLLYLIRKQNFNVLDIPMAEVTRQYLGYIEQIRKSNLELAGEYLLMAAMLIEIKSRMLLPVRKSDGRGEVDDPRAELVRRLLDYERMKKAAYAISEIPVAGRDFSLVEVYIEQALAEAMPDVHVADLSEAWRAILARARMTKHHRITREQLSVRAHMSRILKALSPGAFVEFCELFEPERGVALLVVSFLACLELARESMIEITQQKPFDPIYVKLKSERATLTIA